MESLLTFVLLLVIFSCGYLLGYRHKQEREWLNGYRNGLKDSRFDKTAIIEKYSKKWKPN